MSEQAATKKYNLFVSYAEPDREWVEGFLLDALLKAGITCHTEAAFELGRPRLLAFEEAIQQSQRILLVISPAYLLEGYSQFLDLLAQQYGLETGTWPVIPLVLRPVELPLRLKLLTRIEATEQKDREPAVKRLAGLFARPLPPAEPIPPPPYPGLRSFREEESHLFYGRRREVEDLVHLLYSHPFLALIGPSGSGKSSLVYAGLIPALRRSNLFGPGEWLVRCLRPGENPVKALTDAVGGDPHAGEAAVSALFAAHPDAGRLLIFVDQFEELFTVVTGETRPFQEMLARLAEVPKTYVVLAVRADFYPELMVVPLWPRIHDRHYDVLPLDEAGLADAIAGPAEQAGIYVEATLVERLAADAGGEPGILPFVQETMRLLWDKVERRYLPLSAYEALVLPRAAYGGREGGQAPTGLQAAIALHADAVLNGLPAEGQAIARRIFVRLVHFGEGRAHTRRQQPVSRLRGAVAPQLFDRTLAHLADERGRLLVLSSDEAGPERKVDIAHEALIGAWPALQGWLADWRDKEALRRRFAADVDEWNSKGRDAFFIYEGTKLCEIEAWAGDNPEELSEDQRTFLRASQAQDRRRRQVRLFVRAVVVLFALIGIFATGYFARQIALNLSARGPMVHFPAGRAVLGSNAHPGERGYPKKQEVSLAAFSMDQHEVTNRQYRLCMQAGVCLRPFEPASVKGIEEADDALPVVYVNAYQAAIFCRWIGRRLPTEAEWEHAARGADGRTWPWGEEAPTPARANVRIEGYAAPIADVAPDCLASVDDPRFSAGATPEGITHMLGNAFEWTRTPGECADPYDCPVPWNSKDKVAVLYQRGLSCMAIIDSTDLGADDPAILSRSLEAEPTFFGPDVGFRCAK